jgi:citrate lyase subunit beta / citryl-CoA lyase
MTGQSVRRSWLILPGHRSDLIERSWTFDADVVVLDLEDLVHDQRKAAARANVRDGIDHARQGGAEVFVRCDLELLYADLDASVWRGLQGVILPKVTSVAQIQEAEDVLTQFETERGVMQAGLVGEVNEFDEPRRVDNSLELHLALENAEGNHAAPALLTANGRIRSASLGRADLVMDLRGEPSGELHLLPFLMQRLVVLANTVGVSPIGAWWQANSRGLRAAPEDTLRSAGLGRRAGFRGALCVAPEQVASLNEGFTPTAEEVREAERALRVFRQAEAEGRPYAELGGVRLTPAAARRAQAVIEEAAACAARDAAKRAAREAVRA